MKKKEEKKEVATAATATKGYNREDIYANIRKKITPVFPRKAPTTAWREMSAYTAALPDLPYELAAEEELGTPTTEHTQIVWRN